MAVKTVWVLGAGFSRSLGGPLLPDLLSPATNNFVGALYGENPFIGRLDQPGANANNRSEELRATATVRNLYRDRGPGAAEGKRFWPDAEVFLDQLDAAALGPKTAAARRLQGALDDAFGPDQGEEPGWNALRNAARRLVAAAACAFLKDADLEEERWQPYRGWAQQANRSDSIVTFNYDRVLELIGGNNLRIVHPTQQAREPDSSARVYKLHGSVDWLREERSPGKVTWSIGSCEGREELALTREGNQIGIATPGPSKRIAAEQLSLVWQGALDRLREANVIVFMGYRFPPSDAEAREKLLGAIQESSSKHLELHIVLGPDRKLPDVVRLEQLLRYSVDRAGRHEYNATNVALDPADFDTRRFRLSTHALFAEDFLTVWDRKLLWRFKDPSE